MKTLMVMAGGTGGHVFPALAVADYLRSEGVRIVWLGTKSGIEARLVPAAGFEIRWMTVSGLRGKGLTRLLAMPLMLSRALYQGIRILWKEKPDALLGMGGFVAGPGAISAALLGKPVLIHEANACAGLTNRLLAPLARKVMTGFPDTKGLSKTAEWIGNPVRSFTPSKISTADDRNPRSLNVLIFGGSQGALALNRKLPPILSELQQSASLEVWHQTGKGRLDDVKTEYENLGLVANVVEFIDNMDSAYKWADLVICRSGAMTVAELCITGSVAILVPYPYAAGDHQAENARFMTRVNAGFLVPENDLSVASVGKIIIDLINNPQQVEDMSRAAQQLSRPEATHDVAHRCLEVMRA